MASPDSRSEASNAEMVQTAQTFAAVRDWPAYFDVVLGKPARPTLLRAIELIGEGADSDLFAVDLGCGEGRDTLALLRRGWRVLGIDRHPRAFELLLPRLEDGLRERFESQLASFADVQLPPANLVNASYSLPFCEPGRFARLWGEIVNSLRRRGGGVFAGQFFGERDDWAALEDRSHFTEQEVRGMLDGFDVVQFEVEEQDKPDAFGNAKHWHIFHVVARWVEG